MKFLTKLFFVSALLLPCFSAFAEGNMYIYGDVGNRPSNTNMFHEGALIALMNKYNVYLKVEKDYNGQFYLVSGHHFAKGVYMLQTIYTKPDKSTVQTDLIFQNLDAAQAFEKDLVAAADTDSFYASPVGEPLTYEAIAVGYLVPYPLVKTDVPTRYKIKHYFIKNSLGYQPGKNE